MREVCLIADGRLIECSHASEFFSSPRTELGQEYLRSGNCWPRDRDSPEAEAADPAIPVHHAGAPFPGGFHWIVDRRLGGMQRPGLLRDVDQDLRGLRALGCQWLISLTRIPFDPEKLAEYGIRALHFSIRDMSVPVIDDARELCKDVSDAIDRNESVVFHCKAGLGRTGTMLSCVLVHRGDNPVRAIERVRCVNPRYIQSKEQLAFIEAFHRALMTRKRREVEA